jgi:predicted nucleic acid-binding protein
MKLVVNDANVLIDLAELELVHPFFQLPFEFHTTRQVLGEIDEEQKAVLAPYITAETLVIHNPSEEELLELYDKKAEVGQLSDKDLSAFIHARNMEGTLLTSDNPLRKYSKEQGVEVHGHLWILDRMVEEEQLPGDHAAQKLDELNHQINPKLGLPRKECEKRKERWRNGEW